MRRYRVHLTPEAEQDLLQLFDFQLEQGIARAERTQAAIAKGLEMLEVFPFSCRKAVGGPGHPFLREMIIPFGQSGYVALFQIDDASTATSLALRHPREEDYH